MGVNSSRMRPRVRRPRMRVHRLPHFSVNRLVPNILTLLALCAGMTAMRFAMNGYFQAAVYAIIVAGIFDGLDGRIARLLKSTSRFGAELDSLSDFVSFGVAPASVLYLWTMSQLHSIGWAIVLFFAVCCALRLARFNTQLAEPPPYAAGFFSGAPAPAGAGLVMMPMFASFEWGDWIARSPYLSAVWISGVALLMISTVPTVSLKRIVRVPHHLVIPTLLGVGVATAFLTTAPWPTLTCVGLVYLGSIPLTVRAYYRLRHAAEARRAEPAETAARTASAAIPYSIGDSSPPANEWRH